MRKLFEELFPPRQSKDLTIRTQRMVLRPPLITDFEAWSNARLASRAFLEPWEPTWPSDDLTRTSFKDRCAYASRDAARDEAYMFLIFLAETNDVIGGITLGQVRRRAAQCATLGYWMHHGHVGRGYMTEAVEALCRFGFGALMLQRIEAGCLLANKASIRVLEKAGFEVEGIAKAYLQIAGRRQDHLLFARLANAFSNPSRSKP